MLTDFQILAEKTECVQLGQQILWMVDGGEDTCCALNQWGRKWIMFNKYSESPNLTTTRGRLFANQFVQTFE